MDLSICIFVAFFLLFRFVFICFCFCFFFAFFCFFSRQKAKKSKIKAKTKAKKKQIEKAKKKATKMQMDKSIFFPFSPLFDGPFFSHLFCFLFFLVLKFCFLIFHAFSFFLLFFQSLKNIRISYRGGHNLTEILPGDVFQRACAEILPRDLVVKILDLVKRTKILLWDLLQRSCVEISYRSYRDLVQIALQRNLAQQLLQRTCQGVLHTIFYRDLHKGHLQNLAWYLFVMLLATLFGGLFPGSFFTLRSSNVAIENPRTKWMVNPIRSPLKSHDITPFKKKNYKIPIKSLDNPIKSI